MREDQGRYQKGQAVDCSTIRPHGLDFEAMAHEARFREVGVAGWCIHVDTRKGKDRRWTYASLSRLKQKFKRKEV